MVHTHNGQEMDALVDVVKAEFRAVGAVISPAQARDLATGLMGEYRTLKDQGLTPKNGSMITTPGDYVAAVANGFGTVAVFDRGAYQAACRAQKVGSVSADDCTRTYESPVFAGFVQKLG